MNQQHQRRHHDGHWGPAACCNTRSGTDAACAWWPEGAVLIGELPHLASRLHIGIYPVEALPGTEARGVAWAARIAWTAACCWWHRWWRGRRRPQWWRGTRQGAAAINDGQGYWVVKVKRELQGNPNRRSSAECMGPHMLSTSLFGSPPACLDCEGGSGSGGSGAGDGGGDDGTAGTGCGGAPDGGGGDNGGRAAVGGGDRIVSGAGGGGRLAGGRDVSGLGGRGDGVGGGADNGGDCCTEDDGGGAGTGEGCLRTTFCGRGALSPWKSVCTEQQRQAALTAATMPTDIHGAVMEHACIQAGQPCPRRRQPSGRTVAWLREVGARWAEVAGRPACTVRQGQLQMWRQEHVTGSHIAGDAITSYCATLSPDQQLRQDSNSAPANATPFPPPRRTALTSPWARSRCQRSSKTPRGKGQWGCRTAPGP